MAKASICSNEAAHFDEVSDGIFLGDVNSSYGTIFQSQGITHIISLYQIVDPRTEYEFKNSPGNKFDYFDVLDESKTDWKGVWETIQQPIATFLKDSNDAKKDPNAKQPKLLFQCQAGLRRSALMACCFLVKHRNFSLLEAMTTVTRARLCQTNKYKVKERCVSFYKTAKSLLEDVGGTELEKDWFEAETWNNNKEDVYRLAGYEQFWAKASQAKATGPKA